MPILQVEHIRKSFDSTDVLRDVSFSMEKGDVMSIIGSSGSGKTTLLRCLNGLIPQFYEGEYSIPLCSAIFA